MILFYLIIAEFVNIYPEIVSCLRFAELYLPTPIIDFFNKSKARKWRSGILTIYWNMQVNYRMFYANLHCKFCMKSGLKTLLSFSNRWDQSFSISNNVSIFN
jgi:hypothetical protein